MNCEFTDDELTLVIIALRFIAMDQVQRTEQLEETQAWKLADRIEEQKQ